MWRRISILSISILVWSTLGIAQSLEETNARIKYLNESIHGGLIVHRIYESFNQEINKHIDLPSYKIEEYTNGDLPNDVFLDPERWFYEVAPAKIIRDLKLSDRSIGARSVKDVEAITSLLNRKRIDIEDFISKSDLEKVYNLSQLYQELESISDAYTDFSTAVASYEKELLPKIKSISGLAENRQQVYISFAILHYDIKEVTRLMTKDQRDGILKRLNRIKKNQKRLEEFINKVELEQKDLISVFNLVTKVVKLINEYCTQADVPQQYTAHGDGYYYHNVKVLTLMNRYGNGYVSEMNQLMDKYQWNTIHFIEEPHHFKTIYPKLTPKEILNNPTTKEATVTQIREGKISIPAPKVDTSKGTRSNASDKEETERTPTSIPPANKEPTRPPLDIVETLTLYVDSIKFALQLHDHLIKDGDRLSINVNGTWQYHDISIETEPKILTLRINPSGDNYIIIQALNEGWRPPNTVGIRYRGIENAVSKHMKVDLKSGQAVRINYKMR